MSKQVTQVNFRMPVTLKRQLEKAVAKKNEGSITEEVVSRLQLTFDLTKADGYNHGYRDATAHMTYAVTKALLKHDIQLNEIQDIIKETMQNFDKNIWVIRWSGLWCIRFKDLQSKRALTHC